MPCVKGVPGYDQLNKMPPLLALTHGFGNRRELYLLIP
jgi:hypothetical protein